MIPTWVPAAAVMNVTEYLNVNITLYYNISHMHRNTECQLQLDPQHHYADALSQCIMSKSGKLFNYDVIQGWSSQT